MTGASVSVYAWLGPRVVFPVHALLSGRRSWTQYRQLQALEWQSATSLEARSLRKVRALIGHAVTHVPFYRERFGSAGIGPESLETLDDLAHVPITTKADLRDSPPDRTTADNLPTARRWRTLTSGSTGFPFEFSTDAASADGIIAAYLFFLNWGGAGVWHTRIDIGHRHEQPMPSILPRPSWPMRWARRMLLGERVIALSGKDLPPDEFVRWSRAAAPRGYVVRGYAAYLARLAWRLLDAGVTLPAPPRVVISGGETLLELEAETIERAFGCKVVNQYSAWEVPHMAQTCPDNPALLHVNSERAVVRVVAEDGRPANPGTQGRIVVTSLENYVMPFINYEIGDWGIAGAPCPCGRGFPTLAKVEGRLGETIWTPSGRLISPVTLDGVFRFRGRYVREYQAERTAADTLTVRIVPTSRFGTEIASELQLELAQYVGPGMTIQVETVAEIPAEPSGKRHIIKPSVGRGAAAPSAPRCSRA